MNKNFPIYVYHAGFLLFAESAYLPPETALFGEVPFAASGLHAEKVALARLALDRARETYRDSGGSSPELGVYRSTFDGSAFRVFLASEEELADLENAAPDSPEVDLFTETTRSEESEAREALGL